MNHQTILVTGGAGYVGSHVCKALAARGYQPITFDNLSTGHKEFVKWGPLVIGDLLDQERLSFAFDTYRFQAVIHLAAYSDVAESVREPAKYWGN